MSRASTSTPTSNVSLPPPFLEKVDQIVDPYAKLTLPAASQAQILRSYQRDSSQITRLVDLISELLRSMSGTRWLALRQPIVDLVVKALYLSLTLGRAVQTLGEEYTDILPLASRTRKPKLSYPKRIIAILCLLTPNLLTISPVARRIRGDRQGNFLSTTRDRVATWLESPVGQSLAELHTVAFLYGGRYLEVGRRMTGMGYISTTAPGSAKRPSYEPLALLLLLPLLARLWNARQTRRLAEPTSTNASPTLINAGQTAPPFSKIVKDDPNTYLTAEASDTNDRQCTLCLEPRGTGEGSGGTVAVTECGHVFCWGCLGGLDKLECPLCRQSLRMERLIVAYNL